MDHGSHARDVEGPTPEVASVKDPVCGMTVTPGKARGGSATHDGHEYWFCNPRCRDRFIADPEKYVSPANRPPAAHATAAPQPQATAAAPHPHNARPDDGAAYTCPMHPEVVRPHAGDCPDCGMALEPRIAALTTEYVCP